jgi:hypothetical protein
VEQVEKSNEISRERRLGKVLVLNGSIQGHGDFSRASRPIESSNLLVTSELDARVELTSNNRESFLVPAELETMRTF